MLQLGLGLGPGNGIFHFFPEHNCTPSGKKSVTRVQVVTGNRGLEFSGTIQLQTVKMKPCRRGVLISGN